MIEPSPSAANVPQEICTTRMLLRPWRAEDAAALAPVLEENFSHLSPWIPRRVWESAPVDVLAQRLAGFAAEFAATREWRYAMFARDDGRVLGEVALFPRAAEGRVAFEHADRGEVGYWLRSDDTGRGLATEGVEALLQLAESLPSMRHVEIRCDTRNAASAAIPRRLGFELSSSVDDSGTGGVEHVTLQVWIRRTRRGMAPGA